MNKVICSVDGCVKTNGIKRGMCNMHYLRWKRHGDVNFVKSMRTPKGTQCKVSECSALAVRKLMCTKHYRRVKAHGDPSFRVNATYGEPQKWIENHVANPPDTDDCVEWPFSKCQLGYGRLRNNQAHRVVLKRIKGRQPSKKLHCAHKCGNRACVNPRHLKWATPLENSHDRRIHGTSGMKLSEQQAKAIYAAAGMHKNIAEEFGVSGPTVSEIKSGKTWSWATGHNLA